MGKKNIAPQITLLTMVEVIKKAAELKGLVWWEKCSHARSKCFKEYTLDEKTLAVLEASKITRQERPDCHFEILTLVDENPQIKTPGWAPSNYWNFPRVDKDPKKPFDLRVSLSCGFNLSESKRGVVFYPVAHGTGASGTDDLPNFRMFKALTNNDPQAPQVAKELATTEDGYLVVSFTELGLGGLRSISKLFDEFAKEKDSIRDLSYKMQIFNPPPNAPHCQDPGECKYVPEPSQPALLKIWHKQLKDYRESLVI